MSVQVVRVSDFCATGSGGTPSRRELDKYYAGGSIPWVKSGELREGIITETEERITDAALRETSVKLVPRGALLLAMYGATVGRLATLGVEAATNQAVCHIVPDPNVADTRYLFHALAYQVPSIVALGVGGAQPNISQGVVKNLKIALPPLPEQRRIAAILDKTDALRVKRRAALMKLDELTQSIFLDMFGDPVTNPKRWPVQKLDTLGTLDRGVSKHRPRNAPELLDGPYPFVQTGDVANCGGYIAEYSATYSDAGLKQSKMWSAGTLCITIAANIAKTGVLTFDACFPDSVVGFSADPATVEYVRYWLSFLQASLEAQAPESAQKNINLRILRGLDVPTPGAELITDFARRVVAIESLKRANRNALNQQDALLGSLQQRAFRGEL